MTSSCKETMKSIMKILWFIIKLPFRILALVIVAPLSIIGIMINLISNMGGVVLSLCVERLHSIL